MHANGLLRFLALLAVICLALAPLAVSPATASTSVESFDPTFGNNGKLLTELGSKDISAQAVAVQADQKLIVAGSVFTGSERDFALLRYCSDGTLDDGVNCGGPGFGTGGRVITDFGGGFSDVAMDAELQADGKIVVVGTSSSYPQFDMAVARYNTDGSLDTTFDGDGLVKVDFQNSDERGYAVAVQPDGKIIIGGVSYITTWGDFALARLCPNGALDDGVNCGSTAFGTGGKVRTDFSGSSDWVDGLAVHEGKIIAGGSGGNKDFAVARYNANGSLDTSFDYDGKQTASFGSGWDYGQDVVVQIDGKIIIAGGGYAGDWNHDFGLVRFNTNGALDSTFDGDGKVTTEFFGYSDRILAVTMQGDKVLAVGYAMHCYGNDLAVARYTSTGSLDTSFVGGGKLTTDFGGYNDAANAVVVQANDKIVAAGDTGDDPGGEEIALARFNSGGSLDTTFDSDGKVTTGYGGGYHLGQGIAAVNGKILVAGWANNTRNNDFALARFEDNGNLDTGFAAGGVAVADFGAGDDRAMAMVALSNGKVVLAGYTIQGNDINFAVARYCSDGKLDNGANCGSPGFGIGGRTITDFGGSDIGQAILVEPGGKIVVVGTTRSCPNADFAAARYNADGNLDTTFSGDGKATIDFSGNWDEGMSVARQTDGKLIMAGSSGASYSTRDFALIRFCANGSLDDGANCGGPGFATGGKITTDFSGDVDRIAAVAVQPDGKIVAAGEAYNGSNDFAMARYCSDGKLDNGSNCGSQAFGTGGKIITDFFNNRETLTALLLLPRGKILVGGTATRELPSGWDEDFGLAMYNPDGSLDSEFGDDGRVSIDFGSTEEEGHALALQPEGKFLVSGESAGSLAMARYVYLRFYIYLPTVRK